MSLEAWGDESPYDTWADSALDAGWLNPEDYSPGALAILNERERQETKEDWSPFHDDQYQRNELIRAAESYIVSANSRIRIDPPIFWPWHHAFWKPKDRRADLVRAGALIAAEIDRLDRAEKKQKEEVAHEVEP